MCDIKYGICTKNNSVSDNINNDHKIVLFPGDLVMFTYYKDASSVKFQTISPPDDRILHGLKENFEILDEKLVHDLARINDRTTRLEVLKNKSYSLWDKNLKEVLYQNQISKIIQDNDGLSCDLLILNNNIIVKNVKPEELKSINYSNHNSENIAFSKKILSNDEVKYFSENPNPNFKKDDIDKLKNVNMPNKNPKKHVEIYNVEPQNELNPEVIVVKDDNKEFNILATSTWPKNASHFEFEKSTDISYDTKERRNQASNSSNSSSNSSHSYPHQLRSKTNKLNGFNNHLGNGENFYENAKPQKSNEKKNQDKIYFIPDGKTQKIDEIELDSLIQINLRTGDQAGDIIGIVSKFGKVTNNDRNVVEIEVMNESNKELTQEDLNPELINIEKTTNGYIYAYPEQCSLLQVESNYKFPSVNKHLLSEVIDSDPIKPNVFDEKTLEKITGRYKGIQGHHNSCYLDATLFSMFAFTDIFDYLLYRKKNINDPLLYEEVQKVLCTKIVNPLRKNYYVDAEKILELRQILNKLSNVSGYTTEEKDPEEFLNNLFVHIFNSEPLLRLNSNQDIFYYQLFLEKDERFSSKSPSVNQLLQQSFTACNLKLKEIPSCLIIQMPRFGKKYKMYPKIRPSYSIDVTDILEDSPRQCMCCGSVGTIECIDCFNEKKEVTLEGSTYCYSCFIRLHQNRLFHRNTRKLSCGTYSGMCPRTCDIPRHHLKLFAVICIETSHYVSFVKCGKADDSPWCFFDSMADREGEENGHNVPEIIYIKDVLNIIDENKEIPENCDKHIKRLLSDAYMCMYLNEKMAMYK